MADLATSTAQLSVRYFSPPEDLRPYFLAFIHLETHVAEGSTVSDLIMPSWGLISWRDRPGLNMHFRSGEVYNSGLAGVAGPFDHAVRLEIGRLRQWTAVLLPAGWSKFVTAPARDYCNRTVDMDATESFALFRPIADLLFAGSTDCEAEFSMLTDFLSQHLDRESQTDEARINGIMAGLFDGQVAKVSQLAERACISERTLARICDIAFGMPPKMLLRRQRFLRSVTQHMLQTRKIWTEAIDDLYHDQPQFVREFREFTGMLPSEFARVERPLVNPVLLESARQWLRIGDPGSQD